MTTFDEIILSHENPIQHLVTPLTPYLICDHFISTEVHSHSKKYIDFYLELKANDLLGNKNYNDIKNFEIIQVQVDYLDFFVDEILPIIVENNTKIILITSQFHSPQIQKSQKTDDILTNINILLWISQNPIYSDNEKYMAFPYGICHLNLTDYVSFVRNRNSHNDKNIKILNQYAAAHGHLPSTHIRKKFDIFGKSSGERMSYTDFLTNILHAEFVISTAGDRDDCYRHYECIGLNAIPVSNISGGYKDIFGENMIYSTGEEMMNVVHHNSVDYNYKKPNRDILTISYWVSKINEKINTLKYRHCFV
jgi:hypothetical protein